MSEYSQKINHQYGQQDLGDLILSTYKKAGFQPDNLTLEDLSRLDQMHAGGRDGTRHLARLAGLTPGLEILDIGSGLGGPARTLAAEFGCRVTGVDITEEYVRAAEQLTKIVGLNDSVTFKVGNALDLEFEDASFDAVWTQTSLMNIENTARVFKEAYRVLRDSGILAVESIMSGGKPESRFPVFWADRAEVSFLADPSEFRRMMASVGFTRLVWQDITQQSAQSNRELLPVFEVDPPAVGMHVYIGDYTQKIRNTLAGLEDGTYVYIYAIYQKSP